IPYDDTPNPGDVYKVWVTRVEDYIAAATALGASDPLGTVDPGDAPGNHHGFVPSKSKTDNFKVGKQPVVEIDTRFYDAFGNILANKKVTWIDTNGASNAKWSYWAPQLQVFHEAHVEGIEAGFHQIVIENPAGATIDYIQTPDGLRLNGPATVNVHVPNINRD